MLEGFFYSTAKIFLECGTKICNLNLLYCQTTTLMGRRVMVKMYSMSTE